MPKPHVPDSEKRIIISARVTPLQKDTLLAVGKGNISGGLDRIMVAMEKVWESVPARTDSLPASTTPPAA